MRVITLNDDEALINYAKPIAAELRTVLFRTDLDFSATPSKANISNAEHSGSFPPPHVIGYGSSSAVVTWKPGQASVRLHHGGPQGAKPNVEVVADILAAIRERKA